MADGQSFSSWVALALVAGCSAGASLEPVPVGEPPPERLSEWNLFRGDLSAQRPTGEAYEYEVNATLFQDGATKTRFLRLPAGGTVEYTEQGPWQVPVGTVVIKTFAFPFDLRSPDAGARLLETRLLVREEDGFEAHVYVWDEAQEEAFRKPIGERIPVDYIDRNGEQASLRYMAPNLNQCDGCHAGGGELDLLGPRTKQMDRVFDDGSGPENQITRFHARGLFDAPPTAPRESMVDPYGDAPLEARARSYLDANCGHCHRPGASAGSTGLWLEWEIDEARALGVCRRPVAAGAGAGGLRYDIVPGRPDESILVFRMESEDPEIKMPELPAVTADTRGAGLIREWIGGMEPAGCDG
jgi:uncharacterized repeat protein (TIGR03806 family)